jgi:PPM family protein phosphatase
MIISITMPSIVNERGRREHNEDNIFPTRPNTKDSLFIVCDGVGGANKGEIASLLVSETIATFIQKSFKGFTTPEDMTILLENAVIAATNAIAEYVDNQPNAKGMATTLALLLLHDGGATIAHVGDSRVYHYRKDLPLFVTEDHSYVNELIRAGFLSAENARSHPKRNIITRAVQASKDSLVKPDVLCIDDIQKGDYFFLCSDGITESVDDDALTTILNADWPDELKIDVIKTACAAKSQDNYTCFLIGVANVSDAPISNNSHFPYVPTATLVDSGSVPAQVQAMLPALASESVQNAPARPIERNKPKQDFLKPMLLILIAILISFCVYLFLSEEPNKKQPSIKKEHTATPTTPTAPQHAAPQPEVHHDKGKVVHEVPDKHPKSPPAEKPEVSVPVAAPPAKPPLVPDGARTKVDTPKGKPHSEPKTATELNRIKKAVLQEDSLKNNI